MFTGCAFNVLKEDLRQQGEYRKISGEVVSSKGFSAPVIVVLLLEDTITPRFIRYSTLKKPGEFSFFVKEGRYRIFAYEDLSRDMHYQPDKRVGHSETFYIKKEGISQITISLPDSVDKDLADNITALKARAIIKFPKTLKHTGEIVSLDSEIFSQKNIKDGLWQPLKMAKEVPTGIFFLEPFSPSKQPVLFIHGVSGSPLNFRALIDHLDRERFQPWIAFYPSGFSLNILAGYFKNQIITLYAKYGFKDLAIVAHSMGGLVSRAMINSLVKADSASMINLFISISTPWNGHSAAESGLAWAPAVIPMWEDVVPGSEFLSSLLKTPLPDSIPHYLLFSYRGSNRFIRENSDGVISLSSQLRQEVQDAARSGTWI